MQVQVIYPPVVTPPKRYHLELSEREMRILYCAMAMIDSMAFGGVPSMYSPIAYALGERGMDVLHGVRSVVSLSEADRGWVKAATHGE